MEVAPFHFERKEFDHESWIFAGLGGLNDKGGFVGNYKKVISSYIDPYYVWPVYEYEQHGFVATPAKKKTR